MGKTEIFTKKQVKHCPDCGGELVIRSSGKGLFQGCNNYPNCQFLRPLTPQNDGHIIKILDGQLCPVCNEQLVLRQGRYGMFIGCHRYPDCQHIESISDANETSVSCPQCKQGHLLQRKSRYGKVFYACNRYPECQFTINNKPISGECVYCHYALLIEKRTTQGVRQLCASKLCGKAVHDKFSE